MTRRYAIVLHIGNRLASISVENSLDFARLQGLVREEIHFDLHAYALRITWRDNQGNETLIDTDEGLRESIHAQQMSSKGSKSVLRFFVAVGRKRLRSIANEKDKQEDQLLTAVHCWLAQATKKNLSPLFLACEAGDLEAVKALLHCTSDMVEDEFMTLSVDERVNKPEELQNGFTPLHVATCGGHKEIVSLLISHGANLEAEDEYGLTPLHIAAQEDLEELAALLIAQNANLEAINYGNKTPLHLATEGENTDVMSLLIEKKANMEARNDDRLTPLHRAVSAGYAEAVSVLLERKADVDAMMEWDYSPLHMAAEKRNAAIMSLLLAHNANVEAKHEEGITALHIAVASTHVEGMSLLITHKADIQATNDAGRTPLEIARDKKIKTLLRNVKGKIKTLL